MSSIYEQSKQEDTSIPSKETNIFSNEREFYLFRLRKRAKKLKNVLYISIIVNVIDFGVIFLYPNIFNNIINLIAISLWFVWNIVVLFLFHNSYSTNEEIDIKSYKKVIYSIYATLFISLIILINLAFILITKVILNYNKWWQYFHEEAHLNETILSLVSFSFYIIINFIMPFVIVIKFLKIRSTLKSVGNLQGQEYSVTYTVSIPANGLGLENISRKAEIK